MDRARKIASDQEKKAWIELEVGDAAEISHELVDVSDNVKMANKDVVKEEPVCWEDDNTGDVYASFRDNAALKQEPYWGDKVGVNIVRHEEEDSRDGSPMEDDNPKHDPVDPEFVNVDVVNVEPTDEVGALMSVDPLRVSAVKQETISEDMGRGQPVKRVHALEEDMRDFLAEVRRSVTLTGDALIKAVYAEENRMHKAEKRAREAAMRAGLFKRRADTGETHL